MPDVVGLRRAAPLLKSWEKHCGTEGHLGTQQSQALFFPPNSRSIRSKGPPWYVSESTDTWPGNVSLEPPDYRTEKVSSSRSGQGKTIKRNSMNIYKERACTRVTLHPGEVDKILLTSRPELAVDGTEKGFPEEGTASTCTL